MTAVRWPNLGLVPRAETSPEQIRVLQMFRAFEVNPGWPPTMREICARLGLTSTHGVAEHIERLIRKGLLHRRDVDMRSRAVMLTDRGRAFTTYPLPEGVVFLAERECWCGTRHFLEGPLLCASCRGNEPLPEKVPDQ